MKSKKERKTTADVEVKEQLLRVLVIDDSQSDADLLIRHLQSSGYQLRHRRVFNAATLEEALDKEKWDLVICDYSMPDFNVHSAIALLRKRKLDLPFIVVSGSVGEALAVEVMRAGAHDFILKDNLARLNPAIERELREAALRVQRAADVEKLLYLAGIVDSTGEAILSQNMEGNITTWNAGARQLFGYDEAEVLGRPASILIPEPLHAQTKGIFDRLRKGEAVEPFETVRLRKDGGKVDVYLALSPIRCSDGRLLGSSSIAYDITERKKIEEERTNMIQQLNETLSKVKTLSGLLPICSSCKKIRDDKGYWQKLETFVHEHSNAEFSHSLCPDCMDRLYPDFTKKPA